MARSALPPPTPAALPAPAWMRLKRAFGAVRPQPARPVAEPWPVLGGTQDRPLPRFSDYAIEQVVARNDRTTIYRATECASGQPIALKTVRLGLREEGERGVWRERFLRESAAAARLKHDAIVRVRAGGVQGEGDALTGWLAMEWVPGTDLSRYATRARLLPEGMVLAIAGRIALALDFAHRAGVVHRDVKPSNVLFDPTLGAVKVTDFGSARVADTAATRSGLIMGTPAYMAPEQLAGAVATPQCDLYGLGVMLFELLVGRRPFEAASMGALLAAIAHQPPPHLRVLRPDLPPQIDHILARLLAKSPELRYADGRELAHELRLAQTRCETAIPRSTAAGWADTLPADDSCLDPTNGAPEALSIQGTIAD